MTVGHSKIIEPPTTSSHPNIIAEVRALGAVSYNLLLPETKAIPQVLRPDEKLLGLVYGRYHEERNNTVSRGVLLATDQRVILLNKKPMYMKHDEISYKVVSGVSYTKVAFMGTVTLHSRIGDISIRTFNQRCARLFVKAIEQKVFTPESVNNQNYDN